MGYQVIFIADSHSRDDLGKPAPNGKAVLMKFSSLRQVKNYITENYSTLNSSNFCQIQYLLVEIVSSQSSDLAETKMNTPKKEN